VTQQELARGAARRLAIIRHAQKVTGNVSMTCRYYGITRQAYYTWLRRYEEQVKGATSPIRLGGQRIGTNFAPWSGPSSISCSAG